MTEYSSNLILLMDIIIFTTVANRTYVLVRREQRLNVV